MSDLQNVGDHFRSFATYLPLAGTSSASISSHELGRELGVMMGVVNVDRLTVPQQATGGKARN